jgi:aspartyl protease family protein
MPSPVTSRQSQPRGPLVRLFLIAALFLSGVSLLPSSRRPVLAPPYQPSPTGTAAPTDSAGSNTIVVDGGGSGRFVVPATVNGVELAFLVDSGASDVVLSPADAARVGFRRSQLRFSGSAATANGDVRLAPVTLRELRVGQFSQRGVPAVVNGAEMPISLLGMSFLARLDGWEAKGDRLMLYW